MVKDVIPQEDNTSEILKADLLRYSFINRQSKLRRNRTNANPAKRQECAIQLLEEERNNLVNDLDAALCKSKVKEDEKYRAKFANLIRQINHTKLEWKEQRKIEAEVDQEIFKLETEQSRFKIQSKRTKDEGPILNFSTINNEYNKLIDQQIKLKTQMDALLKRRKQYFDIYNILMNKLNKGKQLVSDLGEQVARTYIYRNEAKERLELFLKSSKTQIQDHEKHVSFLKRQLHGDLEITEFLSHKLQRRKNTKSEKKHEDDTEILALNAEAETFINHLIFIADERNLEKVMEEIVKMDLDNKCMIEFLISIETYLTDVENSMEKSQTTVTDRLRVLSDLRAAKTERLASLTWTYKEGCAPLRKARRTLRLMAAEWQRVCRELENLCDLMGMDRQARGRPLYQIRSDGEGTVGDDDGGDVDGWRLLPDPADLTEYFGPIDRRLNEVLFRLFYVQENRVAFRSGGGDSFDAIEAGDSMSTSSEQEDEFIARDLDGGKNRHAKMMAAVDPTAVPVDDKRLDVGFVPSLCPDCLEKRFEEDEGHQGLLRESLTAIDKDKNNTPITGVCRNENVHLKDIKNDDLKVYYHRTVDCPMYNSEKFHKKGLSYGNM